MIIKQLDIFGKKKTVWRSSGQRERVATVLHDGGGVQTMTLTEMVIAGELQKPDFVIFADTGNEPEWVYRQVAFQKSRLASVNVPLITVKRPGLNILDSIYDEHSKFISLPLFTRNSDGSIGRLRRQCTNEFKIVPCDNYVLNWLVEEGHASITPITKGKQKGGTRRDVSRKIQVDYLFGISWDEWDRAGKRGPQWQHAVYPLIDKRMTRDDCLIWLADHGIPLPEKSSCKICPFHTDAHLLHVKIHHPADFEQICAFDDWLRLPGSKKMHKTLRQECFVHWSCTPLRSIDLMAIANGKLAMPLYAQEMCGDHCRL